jgi:hypothetical protein
VKIWIGLIPSKEGIEEYILYTEGSFVGVQKFSSKQGPILASFYYNKAQIATPTPQGFQKNVLRL